PASCTSVSTRARAGRAGGTPFGLCVYSGGTSSLHDRRVDAKRVSYTHVASMCNVKTIQIRNVPDAVHRTLIARAAEAGMSLANYALTELERVANHPPVAQLLARAQARAGGASVKAVVAAVRSGRDRQ